MNLLHRAGGTAPRTPLPAALTTHLQFRAKRIAARTALVLLLSPLVPILLFRFFPVPLTPLMDKSSCKATNSTDWVAYDQMAPALAQAVVASEDNFFCRPPFGFDGDALLEQIDAWWQGERPPAPVHHDANRAACYFGPDATSCAKQLKRG